MPQQCEPVPVRAVLFDLDDTLFDHWACTRTALRRLQSEFPVFQVWPLAELERRHAALLETLHLEVLAGRMSVDEARLRRFGCLALEAGGEQPGADAAVIALAYRQAYTSSWQPVPGARELLGELRRTVRVGVVTNNVVAEQRQKIDACGFAPLVDAVVISEEIGIAKPDSRIFAECLKRLGSAAGEAVMVGDSWPSDIAGARGAGLRAVWFNRFGLAVPDGSAVAQLTSLEPASTAAALILSPDPCPLPPDPSPCRPSPVP